MSSSILILGIGNLLWADEGFGVRAVEALNERYVFPGHVRLLDGGTLGLNLVQHVQDARRLIVFDAIDYGLAPGEMKIVLNSEVPMFMGVKRMSLHQTGFQEVLGCARLTGLYPEELVLIGVQPEVLEDFGGSLSETVRARIDPALTVALEWLARWGVAPQPRGGDGEALGPVGMALAAYEAGGQGVHGSGDGSRR